MTANVGCHKAMSFLVIIGCVLALSALWGALHTRRLPLLFRARACQGAAWRRAFPAASKGEIRAFLSLFIEAFCFPPSEKLKLNHNDSILELYRVMYPKRWMPDALELEILAMRMQEQYGLLLSSVWHERLTIGDLFACARQSAAARQ